MTSLTANGTLFRNAVALAASGTFTQADIVGKLLNYTHNGGETTSDSFGFSVSDGIASDSGQTFAITVTPQNDPVSITSNGGGATASIRAGERARGDDGDGDDPDGRTARVLHRGRGRRGKFSDRCVERGAVLHQAPNFESPADRGYSKTYLVQVRASDGSLSDDQVITVQVGDATEVRHGSVAS